MKNPVIAVVGGGAAGFFSACRMAEKHSGAEIVILEGGDKLLNKVRISGGGRCNVTNACYDNRALTGYYPRGNKELMQVFSRFSVEDVVRWFERKGVKLKTEDDNRMFPVSDSSSSVVECLLRTAEDSGVKILKGFRVTGIVPGEPFILRSASGKTFRADKVLISTGGNQSSAFYDLFRKLGHSIRAPVPSLFTFNIPQEDLHQLMGVSVEGGIVSVAGTKFYSEGPVLITHWGLSGPAVLKLSSVAARELSGLSYQFKILVSWSGRSQEDELRLLENAKAEQGARMIRNYHSGLPERLWNYILERSGISFSSRMADLSRAKLKTLASVICSDGYEVKGKTTFKEEFVTCGGIPLKEVDMRTMESRLVKGLYFAGEVLDVDGFTGGFNFQAAWSTASVAADSIIP